MYRKRRACGIIVIGPSSTYVALRELSFVHSRNPRYSACVGPSILASNPASVEGLRHGVGQLRTASVVALTREPCVGYKPNARKTHPDDGSAARHSLSRSCWSEQTRGWADGGSRHRRGAVGQAV